MSLLFEKRVFSIGDGGVGVYLPAAWCRFHGLKAKDKVTLIVDDEIIILPQKRGGDHSDTSNYRLAINREQI